MKKENLFRLFMFLLPLAVILLLEVGLRLFGAYQPPPLFLEKGTNYQLNPQVAGRYLNSDAMAIPTLYPETFRKAKTEKTFRIFCLGGSTTAGFPFDGHVSFPQQLRLLLERTYAQREIEVINLGISAMNSYTVLNLIPEVLEKSPDMILIYMGHNEFYGVYGSASTFSVGQNGSWVRFYLSLQKLRIVQMLKGLLSSFSGKTAGKSSEKTLMEQVIAQQNVPYHRKQYWQTMANFRENLDIILGKCRERDVPVIISNLVSNEKDLLPFYNAPIKNSQYASHLKTAERHFKQGDFAAANAAYLRAFAIDSSRARLWYQLGKVAERLADSANTTHYYSGAKDRDGTRFRASEDANRIIRESAEKHQARFVDMLAGFRKYSPGNVPGSRLICDHLHPDPNGYYLMALLFYQAIYQLDVLGEADSRFVTAPRPYFVTDLDWDIGLLKIHKLLHRWPFPKKQVSYDDYKAHGDPAAATAAYDFIFKHKDWVRAHYEMAESYIKQGRLTLARRHYNAVRAFFPNKVEPLAHIARTFRLEKQWEHCETFYQKAVTEAPNSGMYRYQLAIAQWEQNKQNAALQNMEIAVNARQFTKEERLNARYYLAGFLFETGNMAGAKGQLEEILKVSPGHEAAKMLLEQLE